MNFKNIAVVCWWLFVLPWCSEDSTLAKRIAENTGKSVSILLDHREGGGDLECNIYNEKKLLNKDNSKVVVSEEGKTYLVHIQSAKMYPLSATCNIFTHQKDFTHQKETI